MYDQVLPALSTLFSGMGIVYLLVGVFLGLLFGAIPGVGPTQVMAILLPVSIGMSPTEAIILLLAASSASSQGGAVTAILLNTPGDVGNAASTFDGYEMTKRGLGAKALGAAATAGIVGSVVGIAILVALLPAGRWIVLQFSYPDYFALAIFGLALITVLGTSASVFRTFAAGLAGLLAATVGQSTISGETRYSLGTDYLLSGLDLTAVLVGIFAVAEGLRLMAVRSLVQDGASSVLNNTLRQAADGARSVFTHWRVALRASTVGTLVGLVPGVGGTVANFLAYGLAAKKAGKDSDFGHGDVRGVIAPEAANNGKEGGALLPTLIFGIPGSVTMALLLAALTVHGIAAGPRMMIDAPREVLLLVLVGVIANALASLTSFSLVPFVGQLGKIPAPLLGTLLLVVALTGSYFINQGVVGDAWVALAFGLVGLLMAVGGYSVVTFTIGFVLGPLMERSMFQTIQVSGGSGFFTRPISLCLLVGSAALVLLPLARALRTRRAALVVQAPAGEGDQESAHAESEVLAQEEAGGHLAADAFFLVCFAYFLIAGFGLEDADSRVLPQTYAVVGLGLAGLAFAGELRRRRQRTKEHSSPDGPGEPPLSIAIPAPSGVGMTLTTEQGRSHLRETVDHEGVSEQVVGTVALIEAESAPGHSGEHAFRKTVVLSLGGALFCLLLQMKVLSWVAAPIVTAVMALVFRQSLRAVIISSTLLGLGVYLLVNEVLKLPV
jgi:putative tricarboxylic transport membrane protein